MAATSWNIKCKLKIDKLNTGFWTNIKAKAKISQLVIASIAINIFALISAFYILTVYDRVIPNETTDSLIYLTAGMVAVIIFDFLMKVIRGVLTDEAGIEVDKEVADFIQSFKLK